MILLRNVEGWSAEDVALLGITEGNQRCSCTGRARSSASLERPFRDCNVRAPAPSPLDLGLSSRELPMKKVIGPQALT